jgi:hypothetical protein
MLIQKESELSLSSTQIGTLFGAYSIPVLAFLFLSGIAYDYFGEHKLDPLEFSFFFCLHVVHFFFFFLSLSRHRLLVFSVAVMQVGTTLNIFANGFEILLLGQLLFGQDFFFFLCVFVFFFFFLHFFLFFSSSATVWAE